GPVGLRAARLLAAAGGHVRIGSRDGSRAEAAAASIRAHVAGAKVDGVAVGSAGGAARVFDGRTLVVAAGAAGSVMLPKKVRETATDLKVMIDLNAVPPAGIEGVEVADRGKERDGLVCYGAIGVGDTKMKAHKAAVRQLFEAKDVVLDIDEVYQLALRLP
ncbi:MAG: bifunctional NADP-dependent methylenetetrahydromethanopterin dehydrogenase/methylenetetrahydrofolate dehydrogenase, partial [Gemmataceae bacterium]|nr:bifunctional NADP-dependent methylenetetrahydromethanopterin dehydrogenase/methylenetetrahydrofolate dehydrogenase [Gemmataceae bacterium]